MSTFRNPLRVWNDVYNTVLKVTCNNDIKCLLKDSHRCYVLKKILNILVEYCTGVKICPVEAPIDFVGDIKTNSNASTCVTLCMYIKNNLYNNWDDFKGSNIIPLLKKAVFESVSTDKNLTEFNKDEDFTYEKIVNISPTAYCRSYYSSSIISKEFGEKIKDFSNNHIWEHMCGSGYNGWVLKQLGINMYFTDYPGNWFEQGQYINDDRYVDINDEISEENVREIADSGGALMYIWPSKTFHDLELWEKVGGKKLILIVDNNPNSMAALLLMEKLQKDNPKCKLDIHKIFTEVERICPVFPGENGWKCVDDMDIPHIAGVRDFVQLWQKE